MTSDRSEVDQVKYMTESHGNWLTLKYGDKFISTCSKQYGIRGIPTLVVIKPDGDVITDKARADVMDGVASFDKW